MLRGLCVRQRVGSDHRCWGLKCEVAGARPAQLGFPWGPAGGSTLACGMCSEKPKAVREAIPTSLVGEAQ